MSSFTAAPRRLPALPTGVQNPFVPIPPMVRQVMLLGAAIYSAFVFTGAFMQIEQQGAVMLLVGLSGVFWVGCLFYPLIFYRRDYGYLHPLIFTSLFQFAAVVAKQTGGLISGLPYHLFVVNRSPEELQILYSYGNFVQGLALLATYAGFLMVSKPRVKFFGFVSTPGKSMILVVLGVFALAGVALLVYASSFGNVATFFLSLAKSGAVRASMRDSEDEGLGQFTVPVMAASCATLLWICARPDALRDIKFVVLAVTGCLMAYAISGKRSAMLYPVIMLTAGWVLVNRKVPALRLAAVGVAIFMLIGLLGLFRWANQTNDVVSLDFLDQLSLADIAGASAGEMANRAGAMSTYYAILDTVPSKVAFRYGETYLEYPFIFIPRYFWPAKPRGVDTQAGRTFANADWGMPPGSVGEAYWNFHVPGVIIVFGIFGVILRWLAALYERNAASPLIRAFYVLTVFGISPTQNSVRGWVQLVIPLLVIGWAMGLMRRQPKPRPALASADSAQPA